MRFSGSVLVLDVVAMHVLAPVMSAGYPRLSGFGWGPIVVGYLAFVGLVVGLVVLHRHGDVESAAHRVDDVEDIEPGGQEPGDALRDDVHRVQGAGRERRG